jgi:O-acetyl-ADP-ribose deacetylase
MPIVSVEVMPTTGAAEHLSFDPELGLEDVLAELDEWSPADAPCVVEAHQSLMDATILQAAARLHRLSTPVILRVRSQGVRDRVRRALPGSGGRRVTALGRGRELIVAEGDILAMPVDAVVNASNRMLRLGAGVSGAVARAARPSLQMELTRRAGRDGLLPGAGILTGPHGIAGLGGIIHVNAVSGAPDVVRRAAQAALRLAEESGYASVAIPLLGTGTGGLTVEAGLQALAEACGAWSTGEASSLSSVWVVAWSDPVYELALEAFGDLPVSR